MGIGLGLPVTFFKPRRDLRNAKPTAFEVAMPTAPEPVKQRSVVGQAVVSLDRIRQSALARIEQLTNEIEARNDELRQHRTSLRGIDAHLLELAVDPALTDAERALAEAPISTAIEHLPDLGGDDFDDVPASSEMATEFQKLRDMPMEIVPRGTRKRKVS